MKIEQKRQAMKAAVIKTKSVVAALLATVASPALAQGFELIGADWRTIYFNPDPQAQITFVMVNMGEDFVRIEGDRRLASVAMASTRKN